MKYLNALFTAVFTILTGISAAGALTGDWQIYPSFDQSVVTATETANYVYFAGYPRDYNPESTSHRDPFMTLFRYNKEDRAIEPLTTRNLLSENYILNFAYNADKKYLLVVYDNYNIDLIYEDGKVRNVSTLKSVAIPGRKQVNQITFSAANNQAFIATHFGYVCIDDNSYEISESRNYNTMLRSVARIGDRLMVVEGSTVYVAPFKDYRGQLGEYTVVPDLSGINMLYPMDDGLMLALEGERKSNTAAYWVSFQPDTLIPDSKLLIVSDYMIDAQPTVGGVNVTFYGNVCKYSPGWVRELIYLDETSYGAVVTSADMRTLYSFNWRNGMRVNTATVNGGAMSAAGEFIRPDTPAANYSANIKYHPRYGMLVGSIGAESIFVSDLKPTYTNLLSGFKDGRWTEYSPYYTNPARGNIANCSFGLAIDPDNDKYIYRGSNYNGLVRYNLEDPEDILHLSRDNDPDAGNPGYIKVVDHADIWDILCRFNNPQFDSNGDLYLSHNNLEGEGQRYELWRWSAENRKASVTAERFRPFDRYILPGIEGSNSDLMLVCRHRSNANKIIILASHNETERRLIILDHKGTFTTPSDDKFVIMSGGTDQDGGTFNITGINGFYEDPESGLIWISSDSGVYTMNLSRQNSSTATLNRVKVARNDGTNLADYLLNEVKVNSIIDDGQGRKWYSTSGGLVCTSSDGRRILGEFTAENSPLPSDNVLSAGYNPANGSILISTDRGIAEFHPSGGTVGTDGSSNVRAYPNPVEPDYYGYVTIDGIPDNSLVKIADSGGGLVRELGRAESGSIQWDLQNLEHKRVATGVYFILVSSGDSSSDSGASVGKILVLN